MKRSLVVGVDGDDHSKNALARAAKQNLDAIEADARRASDDVLQGTGADWEFVVRSGDPAHELMVAADDRPAAAIVVGGRPHKAALSGLVGSIDAALIHRFHGSVLVVRGDDTEWHPVGTAASESEHAAGTSQARSRQPS